MAEVMIVAYPGITGKHSTIPRAPNGERKVVISKIVEISIVSQWLPQAQKQFLPINRRGIDETKPIFPLRRIGPVELLRLSLHLFIGVVWKGDLL